MSSSPHLLMPLLPTRSGYVAQLFHCEEMTWQTHHHWKMYVWIKLHCQEKSIFSSIHDTCFHVVLKRVQYKHLLWRTCPMLHWEWAQLACSQFSTHESQSYFQQHSWRQGPHSCCWTFCPNIQCALSMRVWCLLRQWWHCKCCVTLNFCHNSYQREQQAGQCSAVQ